MNIYYKYYLKTGIATTLLIMPLAYVFLLSIIALIGLPIFFLITLVVLVPIIILDFLAFIIFFFTIRSFQKTFKQVRKSKDKLSGLYLTNILKYIAFFISYTLISNIYIIFSIISIFKYGVFNVSEIVYILLFIIIPLLTFLLLFVPFSYSFLGALVNKDFKILQIFKVNYLFLTFKSIHKTVAIIIIYGLNIGAAYLTFLFSDIKLFSLIVGLIIIVLINTLLVRLIISIIDKLNDKKDQAINLEPPVLRDRVI